MCWLTLKIFLLRAIRLGGFSSGCCPAIILKKKCPSHSLLAGLFAILSRTRHHETFEALRCASFALSKRSKESPGKETCRFGFCLFTLPTKPSCRAEQPASGIGLLLLSRLHKGNVSAKKEKGKKKKKNLIFCFESIRTRCDVYKYKGTGVSVAFISYMYLDVDDVASSSMEMLQLETVRHRSIEFQSIPSSSPLVLNFPRPSGRSSLFGQCIHQ